MSELIGKAIGQYQIIEQIGVGGMATIFKAFQPSIDRYVAIKILPSQLAEDENFVKRFAQEAKAIAALEHPHILPVHDFGTEGKLNYMVMRYVEGGTLSNMMGKPISYDRIVQIVGNVARALDYAHQRGVVHRDIKPSNILIDQHGEVLLTDFGIAKMVEGSQSTQLTAAGSILGTPAYMSPEQAQGQEIDGRSDIYSLGVVLYELLTGRPPYEAETPFAIVLKHINDPLPPPRSVKPDTPEPLERVVLKAMAKDPNQRFETAAQMERSLQNALKEIEGVMIVPSPPTIASKSIEETQLQAAMQKPTTGKFKSPLFIGGLVAVVILCLLGVGGAMVYGQLNSSGEKDVAATTLSNTNNDNNSDTNVDESEEGILFEDDFSSDQNGWYTGQDEDESGDFEAEITDGLYQLYINSATNDGNFGLVEPLDQYFDDFVFTVDAVYVEHNGDFTYGIFFRSDSEDNYYQFELDSDGFDVGLSTKDDWEELVEYTESPAINPEGPNQLMVKAVGPTLSFYINDEEVATIEDDTLQEGSIGLVVGLFNEDSEMYVEFDNVTVFEAGAEGFDGSNDFEAGEEEGFERSDENIIFAEHFDSDDNGWFTGVVEDELGYQEANITDGLYGLYMEAATDEGNFSLVEPVDQDFDDFILSVDAEYVESEADFAYGITFRGDSEGNYYSFELDSNGFSVGISTNDDWQELVEYTESPAIDPDGPNQLTVEAIGPSLTFYINDEEVATIEDDTFQHGSIGLALDLFEAESKMYVEFDNLIIRSVEG